MWGEHVSIYISFIILFFFSSTSSSMSFLPLFGKHTHKKKKTQRLMWCEHIIPGKSSSDDLLIYFSKKTGFDISCKSSNSVFCENGKNGDYLHQMSNLFSGKR